MEGELKRIKNFWSSQKDIYRLKYPHLLVGKVKNKQALEFKVKYDLTLYAVTLSRGDREKFYLVPLNDTLKLSKVEFKTKSAEERARWYMALSKSMKEGVINESQSFVQPGGVSSASNLAQNFEDNKLLLGP